MLGLWSSKTLHSFTGCIAIDVPTGTQITVASPRLDVRHSFTFQVYVKVSSTSTDLQAGLMLTHRPAGDVVYVSW